MSPPAASLFAALPLGDGFTYQGQVRLNGGPINGDADFQFTLWDAAGAGDPPMGGNQVNAMQPYGGVPVRNGLFTIADLNFGAGAFNGEARWLQVAVRFPAGGGGFTSLGPRLPVTATPYALHAKGVANDSITPPKIDSTNSPSDGLSLMFSGGNFVWGTPSGSNPWQSAAPNIFYNAGHVGIGTSAPLGPLDVASGHGSYLRVGGTWGDLHFNGGLDGTFGLFNEGDASGRTSIVTNNIERFSVLNSGRVGIGTSAPGRLLQLGDLNTPDSEAMIRLASRSGISGEQRAWDIGVPETDNNAGPPGYSFVIDDTMNGTSPEFIVRWGSGSVGIANLEPTARLEVEDIFHDGTAIRGNGIVGVYGWGADAGVRGFGDARRSGTSIAVHGIAAPTSSDFFGTFFGGIAVKGESPSNLGVLGTSTSSHGVMGESQNHDGIHGLTHAAGKSGVWGRCAADGWGVAGTTDAGFAGLFGFGPRNGIFGLTSSGTDSGVHGRNDANGWGVNGYAAGVLIGEGRFGGTGVEGLSDGYGGYGVIGRAHGPNGVGVHAEAQNGGATALWAYNPGGRSALLDGYVDVYGAMNVAGSASVRILTITGGADLAEPFDITLGMSLASASGPEASVGTPDGTEARGNEATPIEPGMVVVIDADHPGRLRLSTDPYDAKVAGIISGANGLSPGMVMKADGHAAGDGEYPVALAGRVWGYCDASAAAIRPGDLLTTSATPGHAMKATDRDRSQAAILGKAMTALPEGGKGLVLVLVNLQ